jgi:hypothetical protein
MSGFWSLCRVELNASHLSPGRTKHILSDAAGTRDFLPFKALEICTYPDDSGYYLLYEPETGHGTDTYHETLSDAKNQAEWEFGVSNDEWIKTNRPYR